MPGLQAPVRVGASVRYLSRLLTSSATQSDVRCWPQARREGPGFWRAAAEGRPHDWERVLVDCAWMSP